MIGLGCIAGPSRARALVAVSSASAAGTSRAAARVKCRHASARKPRWSPRLLAQYSTAPAPAPNSSPTPSAAAAAAAAPPSTPPLPIHKEAPFDALNQALSATQPCFGARGDEISLLTSPEEFRSTLLAMLKRAKRRILISSLYIGASQGELVDAIRTALQTNPHLRVSFILDYHRATRLAPHANNPPSTAHLLLPLAEAFPERCEVFLYRSPKLRGLMEKVVPERYDEGWGTWHGKWYCVDDEVVISGANLATSYFTNRQDRYIHFRHHPMLLSYLFSLTRLYTHYSYHLSPSPSGAASQSHAVPLPSPQGSAPSRAVLLWPERSIHPRAFHSHALATLGAFQNSWRAGNAQRMRRVDVDTWFWPVIQAGVLGVKEEEAALAKVWDAVRSAHGLKDGEGRARVEVDITSGYFGLFKAYKQMIVDSPALTRVIAAAPEANGFFGSKGFSRLIPEGYTLLLSRFDRALRARGRIFDPTSRTGVVLKEWTRPGWTYHSKGIWLSPAPPSSATAPSTSPAASSATNPFLTFIGSSNLSTRSLTLDTELSVLLMTSSPTLRKALGSEVRCLDKYASGVGEETWKKEERRVSWLAWVLVALGVEGML